MDPRGHDGVSAFGKRGRGVPSTSLRQVPVQYMVGDAGYFGLVPLCVTLGPVGDNRNGLVR